MNPNSSSERRVRRGADKGRLRERFREETAQAVLTAAEEVFVAHGLHGASMGEIAKRAGVAVGTLYNHFADRETLLGALLDTRCTEMLAEIDGALRELGQASFVDQLVALVSALFSGKEKHRSLFMLVISEERAGVKRSGDMAKQLYARVDKLIKRGVKEGYLREAGADSYAALLMGMMRGAMMRELYGAPSGPLPDAVGRVVDLFLHGARRK